MKVQADFNYSIMEHSRAFAKLVRNAVTDMAMPPALMIDKKQSFGMGAHKTVNIAGVEILLRKDTTLVRR